MTPRTNPEVFRASIPCTARPVAVYPSNPTRPAHVRRCCAVVMCMSSCRVVINTNTNTTTNQHNNNNNNNAYLHIHTLYIYIYIYTCIYRDICIYVCVCNLSTPLHRTRLACVRRGALSGPPVDSFQTGQRHISLSLYIYIYINDTTNHNTNE